MSSRNPTYDSGESRRSPRDRSPGRYNNDPRDSDQYRGGAMRGGERRRSISDSRPNQNAFASNRDNFRDSVGREPRDLPPREPPRGPKALVEPPSGPRSSTYGGDYRGDFGYRGDFRGSRGRGRGRGGWRDDSRDRSRELERDYRGPRDDRGPPQFRDDRSRDRDRWERNDSFRGRRPSSPQGRARSPTYAPRENRDGPPSDFDRARRDSRDGPLPIVSPAADSLQPPGFGRGYGRGNRGTRGRGRGGYYDDFHPRNPSPDPNFSRRTQPSATPPPQVPAFGSTSSNLPLPSSIPKGPKAEISGPVPGKSVPTAPRASASAFGRAGHTLTSAKRVNPDYSAKERALDIPQPQLIGSTSENKTSLTEEHRNRPQPLSAHTDERLVESRSEVDTLQNAVEKDQSPSKSDVRSPRRDSDRQRRSISGRRPAEPPAQPLHEVTDEGSDSDSGDDLEDDFVEDDIKKAEEEMARASDERNNPGLPREEPDAIFLKPFIESSIDGKVSAHENAVPEPCVPVEVPRDSAPESRIVESTLSVKPKARGRSRPTTPLAEPEAVVASNINGKGAVSQLEAQISTQFSSMPHLPQAVPSIQQPGFSSHVGPESPAPDTKIKSEAAGRPATNGKTRKSVPMETFEDSESEGEAEFIDATEEDIKAVPRKMKTPPLDNLPDFKCRPWHENEDFLRSLDSDPAVEDFIRDKLAQTQTRKEIEQEEERQAWKERYLAYRRWTDFSNDIAAVRSRDKFAKSREKRAAEAAAILISAPTPGSKPEPQRRTGSRFATEHDIERVLRESEQEARETKEREERFARAQTASAKEAKIPDMCWDEEERLEKAFTDRSQLVPFERSFAILEYAEPEDNFTAEECAIFEKAYLETPKQWGKIAEALPRRNYKACIQHYYLVKRDTQLKEKVKKQPKRRKRNPPKGAKPKSNALMADIVSRDEGDDGADLENGSERRRPRRAAAPTFAFEATPGDSEAPSPALTPGRKPAATPKGDNGSESAAPKKRAKATREKVPKQSKNSQLLAAAPTPSSRGAGSPGFQPNTTASRGSSGATTFPQYDGTAVASNFIPHFGPSAERSNNSMTSNFEVMAPPFADQERMGSAPPMGFDAQQDRRGNPQQPTSSYWSVPEQNDFPELLRYFGTDWGAIAKHMTSKTHVMVYNTVFQQWLIEPSDTNKSRRVANIEKQVKNYYARQIEGGKMESWVQIARDADAKRLRGESTGPLPAPTIIPKRHGPQGSIARSGSAMDIDEMPPTVPTGPNMIMQQGSPPVSSLGTRFPPLAQAGSVAQPAVPATPSASLINKHVPQQPSQHIQQQMQPQSRRGPALGYFNPEPQRPLMQGSNLQQSQSTPSMQDSVSQRSLMVAQEAQIERQQALRLEQAQAQAQAQQHAQAQQAQAQAQAQAQQLAHQQAMQKQTLDRDRQLQMKQEAESPNPHQYEQYSTPTMRTTNSMALSRSEVSQSIPPVEVRRTAPPSQYQPQSHPVVRSLLSESSNGGRASNQSSPSPALPRAPMSAPPASQEQFAAPPPSRTTPVAAVRLPETTRKTSNIMALLNNDEVSDPRPQPSKRISDVTSAPLQASQTPPPQHSLQPSRYPLHSSQATSQPPQQIPQPMAQMPPQSQPPQSQNPYASSSQHPMHQHSTSVGQSRSYTPNSFEHRGYGQPPSVPQQQQQQSLYSQPPRQNMGSQPPPLRREPSLGDMHGVTRGYGGPATSTSASMRLKESPYSATPPPLPPSQASRQQIASPLDHAPAAEREYYSRQPSYLQPQSSAAGSPQLVPQYHSQAQQQQPSHRQLAFGQGVSHTASPPTSCAQAMHRSRQNSFDGRYPSATTSAPPQQQGYTHAPQHQGTPLSMQYQQQHAAQDRYESSYERRLIEEQHQARMEQQRLDQQRLEQHRLAEERDRRRGY